MSQTVHMLRRARPGNEALSEPLSANERAIMVAAATAKIEELFAIFQVDRSSDQHTRDTPGRVARMFVDELMGGRFTAPPRIAEFDCVAGADGLLVTGPIALRSMCAHHLMPVYGHVTIGVLPAPDGKIIGLSKYDRIVDHFARRLQIQEELVGQIGQYLVDAMAPRGLALRISAVHMCKTHRGILASQQSRMVSTAYFGEMRTDPQLKAEFLQECRALERSQEA